LGIPYDSNQTFSTGSRFAPSYIRLASDSIEEFSIIFRKDVRDCNVSDWGDIEVSYGNYRETERHVIDTLREINAEKLILIGGDHSISIFSVNFFSKKIRKYVQLDAHGDFDDSYLNSKYTHSSTLRRIGEILGWENIVLLGLRSISRKTLEDLEKLGVKYYTSADIERDPSILTKEMKDADYISLDMDFFDIAYAPEVGNPEPLGLSPQIFINNIREINPRYFDIVEARPKSAESTTAILAATILREVIIKMDEEF